LDNTNILVTGGAGFIGSALCRKLIKETNSNIIVLDKMTYASNLDSLKSIINNDRLYFINGSMGDESCIEKIFLQYQPEYVFNLAAETHVDNSITNPFPFIKTNIVDTHFLIDYSLKYFLKLKNKNKNFKFLQISTDEVYGDIGSDQPPASEASAYNPSSPYSASKAAGDHLIKAYNRTYGFPGLVSNCSNNYGPFQHSEKFIPVIINSILSKKKIPVYGNGSQIREWIFVDDHCDGLIELIKLGKVGENYNIGNTKGIQNIELISIILSVLKKMSVITNDEINNYVKYVKDRPGHDKKYAINSNKIKTECNWFAKTDFINGLNITINSILK
jgi:dTDP-glucose 4,6-dehydratase